MPGPIDPETGPPAETAGPPSCSERSARSDGARRPARRLRIIGGLSLCVLLAFLLNDPRQPAPVTIWALVATALVLGRYACVGVRWLTWHSAVRFTESEAPPTPMDWLAKLVPWIGFGLALPATVLGTATILVMRHHPHEMTMYLHWLLMSLAPTAFACLALLPLAWSRVGTGTAFTTRDRGVLPLAAGLLGVFALTAWWVLGGDGHGGHQFVLAFLVRQVFQAFLPASLPHHVIGVAVACGFLRLWMRCTSGMCGARPEQAP